jgi:archaellum component FlaF (FlaF/FlaG flagellin family)
MGASVGVGALVVGTSLLLIFALAVQTLDNRLDTSLEVIDDAGDPLPSLRIDDATLWEGAVLSVTVNSNGSGYVDGTLVATGSGSGFSGTFTVDAAGGIDTVTITSRGNYSSPPTIAVDTSGQSPGSIATFSSSTGNHIYANLTNTGSVTLPIREVWLFLDGGTSQTPTNLGTAYTPSISSTNWYSGETIFLDWSEDGPSTYDRISFTAGGLSVAHTLA